MKYKVGDRVRIKSLDWYNENKDSMDEVACGNTNFIPDMTKYCEEIITISSVLPTLEVYRIKEDGGMFNWTDEMIEGLVEEEAKPEPKFKVGDSVKVLRSGNTYTISQMKFNGKEFVYTLSNNDSTVSCFSEEEIEFTEEDKYWCDIMSESDPTTYVLPQGYQFVDERGNIINTTKIVLEKKKPKYPKTYEECCYVLGFENTELVFEDDYRDINPPKEQWKRLGLINQFNKLLICRDAYWKLAGEEMKLGKPWEPDWDGGSLYLFYYNPQKDEFVKAHYSLGGSANSAFVFPTAEMRDAYMENFDPDIEKCKFLL